MTGGRSFSGLALAALFALSACGTSNAPEQVDYELVRVGNPGNADDETGFGGVAYPFQIGKFPVTIGQYAAFLNAVARSDPYGLYHPSMGTDLNSAGITRTGTSGGYVYVVMDNQGSSENRPITYVSWLNAARFANWMANRQPTGAQDASTTENGAYALNGATRGFAVAKNAVNPNTGEPPAFYIPLEDEWYKAAYYSPERNDGAGGYYLYATQTDAQPGNLIGSGDNQANYFTGLFAITQSPDYVTTQSYLSDVGAFTSSPSFYGTFDQAGSVWQWNDLDGRPVPYRGMRGGYWFSGSIPLQSVLYASDSVTRADNDLGFRLAAPEAAR